MIRKTIYITEAQSEGLRRLAKLRQVPVSELLRQSVDAVLVTPPRAKTISTAESPDGRHPIGESPRGGC